MQTDSGLTETQAMGEREQTQSVPQSQDEMRGPLRDYTDWILDGWKAERPDLNVAPVAIITRMSRLSSYFRDALAEVHRRFGLSGPSFAVIATLRRAGKPYQLSQRALMDILQLTSGTISVRIDRLIQDGLVERLPDPNDQRGVLVHLMEKGQILFDEAAPAHLAEEDRLLSALTPEQREQLASLLRILLLSFEPIAGEDPRHPSHWIGASLAPAHVARRIRRSVGLPDTPGLLVQSVAIPSPASQTGLREGDLIIAAGGTQTRSIESLYEQLAKTQGGTLSIEVLRGAEKRTLGLVVPKGE
jgi:DNA-binding MarR family transcriptional regulator